MPRIHELRKINGLTQLELAAALNVDARTIQRWESEFPTIPDILCIASYFNVSFDELLYDYESFPEFTIGKTGSINKEAISKRINKLVQICTQGDDFYNVMVDKSMQIDESTRHVIIDYSVDLTDFFSRFSITLNNSHLNTIAQTLVEKYKCIKSHDDLLPYQLLSRDFFTPRIGLIQNRELKYISSSLLEYGINYLNGHSRKESILAFEFYIPNMIYAIALQFIIENNGKKLSEFQKENLCYSFLCLITLFINYKFQTPHTLE